MNTDNDLPEDAEAFKSRASNQFRHPGPSYGNVSGCQRTPKGDRTATHPATQGTKFCIECEADKPLSDFYLNRGIPHTRCKMCYAEMQRRYRKGEAGRATLKRLRQAEAADPVAHQKRNARGLLRSHVAKGWITRGPCARAAEGGCKGIVDGDHSDYSKPLDVTWLCRTHHIDKHRHLMGRKRSEAA